VAKVVYLQDGLLCEYMVLVSGVEHSIGVIPRRLWPFFGPSPIFAEHECFSFAWIGAAHGYVHGWRSRRGGRHERRGLDVSGTKPVLRRRVTKKAGSDFIRPRRVAVDRSWDSLHSSRGRTGEKAT